MKYLNRLTILLFVSAIFFACEDEELKKKNYPGWETAVNGFLQLDESSPSNFLLGDVSNGLDMDFRWISIDGTNTVTQIDFYVTFTEAYTNPDGDPAVADHGTELFMTMSSPAGNREDMPLSIDQADVYSIFENATFDYDEDGSAESVWTYAPKNRSVTNSPFVDGDAFIMTFVMTTEDGRVFDSWSPSTCTELPGSNCQIAWILECGQEFRDPRGIYTLNLQDSFGDGWNGAFITADIDGSTTDYGMTTGASATYDVNVPDGTSSLVFSFTGGDWDSEVTFQIVSEHGYTIADEGPSPADGPVTLNLCSENGAPDSVVP